MLSAVITETKGLSVEFQLTPYLAISGQTFAIFSVVSYITSHSLMGHKSQLSTFVTPFNTFEEPFDPGYQNILVVSKKMLSDVLPQPDHMSSRTS